MLGHSRNETEPAAGGRPPRPVRRAIPGFRGRLAANVRTARCANASWGRAAMDLRAGRPPDRRPAI